MLLYEGGAPPEVGAQPFDALALHGCKAERVEGEEEDGVELSISDSAGEGLG